MTTMMKIAVSVALVLVAYSPRTIAFMPTVRTSRFSTALTTSTPQQFSQDEVLQLLSDDAYAMDIVILIPKMW